MKAAIIGAGFCGLATAWHLLHQSQHFPDLEVTVLDAKGIGGGTSGMATGLLHPYSGAHAKPNWRGQEGYMATRLLLDIAAQSLGQPVTAEDLGILRLALTEMQLDDFKHSRALLDPDVAWLEAEQCQAMVKGCTKFPGLWIKKGLTVYSGLYLQGLWLACERKGARFEQRHISSLTELKDFSIIVVAAGAISRQIAELQNLPLKCLKGQILEAEWPNELPGLPCALNSQAYIVMKPAKTSCLIGSTFEKEFADDGIDLEFARQEIMPKAAAMLPAIQDAKIIGCYAGLRAVSPNHLPMIKRLNGNTWVLTGMGSKGLLYHALMAQELVTGIAQALEENN